jgi:large subunit ribosomal protein L15
VKLHDLRPAPGSRRERTRAGRGIAAGKGKTAGRGTKGQRSRTGSSIPAWFEGGQTPVHMRVPKLRGFKNRFRVAYAVVNVGRIDTALESGRLEPGPKKAPATVNLELLFTAGLVGRLDRPLKILGGGELSRRIMAVADAVSVEARRKIEAAGGTVMIPQPPASVASPSAPSAAEATAPDAAQPEPEAVVEPAADQAPEEAPKTARRRANAGASAETSGDEAVGVSAAADADASADGSAPAPRRSRTASKKST